MDKENLFLCFIKYIGEDINNMNTYELLFTKTPDTFWGENFEYFPSCLCNELIPNKEEYEMVKTITTNVKLDLAINYCCFSYQDVTDMIIPIAWESLADLEEYPEDGRLILRYGITYQETELLLSKKNILINEKED